jgi:hypothetical protein
VPGCRVSASNRTAGRSATAYAQQVLTVRAYSAAALVCRYSPRRDSRATPAVKPYSEIPWQSNARAQGHTIQQKKQKVVEISGAERIEKLRRKISKKNEVSTVKRSDPMSK